MNKIFFLNKDRSAIAEGPLAIPTDLDRPGVHFSNFRHALETGGEPSAAAVKAMQQTGGRLVAQPDFDQDTQTITGTAELFGVDGDIVWAPRALTAAEIAVKLEQAIAQGEMDIDGAAIAVDEKYTTTGGQQGAIYQLKLAQVDAWKAEAVGGGEPDIDSDAYGLIKSEHIALQVTNPDTTPNDAVASIDGTKNAWTKIIAPARETARRAGKEKVKQAATIAETRAIVAAAVEQLGQI